MVTRRVESRLGALDGREMLDEREREERRIYNVLYSIVYRLEEDGKTRKKKQKPNLEEKRNHFVERLRGVANANANKENSKHCLRGRKPCWLIVVEEE